MIITIPDYKVPSLNEYIGRKWPVGQKFKNECKQLMRAYSRHLPNASQRRRVDMHIVLGKGRRKMDKDNAYKLILDSLVYAGMLFNDNDQWCEIGDLTYSRGSPATIITLTDI